MFTIMDVTLEPEAGRKKDGSPMTLLVGQSINNSHGEF